MQAEKIKSPSIIGWIDQRGPQPRTHNYSSGKTILAIRWIIEHIGEEFRIADIAHAVGKNNPKSRQVDDILANMEYSNLPFVVCQDGDGHNTRLIAMWKPGREGETV